MPTPTGTTGSGRIHLLKDRRVIRLRRLETADAPALKEMLLRCSPETRSLRFLVPMPRVTDSFVRLLAQPRPGAGAFAALAGHRIVAVAHHGPVTDGDAEVAVLVEDSWQGAGLGRVLMDRLAEELACLGARSVSGTILRENHRSIGLVEGSFASLTRSFDGPHMDFRGWISDDALPRSSSSA